MLNSIFDQMDFGPLQEFLDDDDVYLLGDVMLGDTQLGMELFKKLNEDGATIIMITHEQEIAEHANKIYYIRDGELREDK